MTSRFDALKLRNLLVIRYLAVKLTANDGPTLVTPFDFRVTSQLKTRQTQNVARSYGSFRTGQLGEFMHNDGFYQLVKTLPWPKRIPPLLSIQRLRCPPAVYGRLWQACWGSHRLNRGG